MYHPSQQFFLDGQTVLQIVCFILMLVVAHNYNAIHLMGVKLAATEVSVHVCILYIL